MKMNATDKPVYNCMSNGLWLPGHIQPLGIMNLGLIFNL